MKRVLVLRAREDAERTAQALEAAGFEPIVSPVIEIVATHAEIPERTYDAALATSANALEGLAPCASAAPLCVVGARTASLAEKLGWRVDLVAPDAAELGRLLLARHSGAVARFLYLAGHDRRAALEAALSDAGHEVDAVVRYQANAARALTATAREGIDAGAIFAALHFSRRSAELFLRLVREAGLEDRLGAMRHIAISENAAEPLLSSKLMAQVARTPDQSGILEALLALAGLPKPAP